MFFKFTLLPSVEFFSSFAHLFLALFVLLAFLWSYFAVLAVAVIFQFIRWSVGKSGLNPFNGSTNETEIYMQK